MLEIRSGKTFFIGLGQVQEGQNHANLLFHSQQRRAGLHGSLFALRNYGVLIFMLAFLLLGKVAWGQAKQITSYNEGISNVFVSETSDSNKSSNASADMNSEMLPLVTIGTKNEVAGRIVSLSGSNKTHIKGETLLVLVSVTSSPVIDMTNGTPYLEITVGSTTKQAPLVGNLGFFLQFTYTITDGDSDTDGIEVNRVVLNGGTIRDNTGLDFDLTIPANANSSLTLVRADGIVPSVTSVAVPSDNTYTIGQNLDFTVNFDDSVSVTGTPQLSLIIGSTTKQAIFQAGSNNTKALLFQYTVQSGDEDTDGIAVGTLTTDGATLQDGPGNSAGLVLTNIGSTGNVKVDAKSPEVNSVTAPADGTYTTGQNLDFTVNFNEPITVAGTPQLSLTVGSATKQAVYQSGSGSTALLFRYTVQSGDEDTDGITVGTLAANGGTLQDGILQDANLALNNVGATTNINVDAVVPTVTSLTVPSGATYATGQNLDFTVNYTESVSVTGTPQISLTVGSTTKQAVYQSGSGSTALLFRYTVQSGDEDTDGIAIGTLAANGGTLQDGAGNGANLTLNNAGATTNINVDAKSPEVSSVTVPADGTYGLGSHLDFTVNFDEVVTVTGTPQLSLTVGSATKQAVFQSGSGSSALLFRYTVQSGDADTDGIAVGTLAANSGTLQDGLLNDANLSLNNIGTTTNIKVNHLSPIVNSRQAPSDGTYTLGQVLNFTVVFDKDVTANTTNGTPYLEVDIGGNIRQVNFFTTIGFPVFQYFVQTNDLDIDGIRVVRLVLNGGTFQDLFGNEADISGFVATDYPNLKIDGVVPAVTNVAVPSDATYTAGQDLDFTVNFDDVVTVTGTPQLSLTAGSATKQAVYQSGSGSTALLFRYTVQSGDEDTDGIAVGTLAANGGTLQDDSGNDASLTLNNVGATTNINVDAKGPEVVSVSVPADGTYTAGQHLDFIVNFNEVVAGDPGTSEVVSIFSFNLTTSTTYSFDYAGGIDTNALTFRYTVQAGDELFFGDLQPFLMTGKGALNDAVGNPADRTLNGFGDLTNIFIDAKAPALDVQTSSLTDGATNVTLSQNLSLAFDDNMVVGTGNITIVETGVGNFEQLDVTNGSLVTVSDSVVTLNPSGTLKKATAYHLLIDATALDDDVSNSFAGVTDPTILNFSTVDVVINEIVTDPQQDWSSTNFASTPSSGSSGTDDEWVELFIKSQGIDLTGWTIELLDGSDVIGDLSSTGAFDVSNYTSSGSGTFTNTAVGDYLVLGNVASSGALNNTGLTINLKDPGGAIVDVVTVGVANPTPFPGSSQSGNSNGVNAESVQRFANGSDTDIDFVDFTFGPASIAAANTGPSVTLSIDNSQISETGTATITATRSANSTQTTTVAIDVKSGSEALEVTDFTLSAKTITIPNGSTTGTVTLTPVQDALFELDENTTIEITGVTNGIEAGNQEASLLILNSDAQPVIAFNTTSSSGDESTSSANLEVTLSAASGVDATVNYTVTGTATNVDYNLADGSLTISAGSTSQNITIASIIDDALDEVDETVIVTLSVPGNATLGTNTVHTYTITDNDPEPTVNLTVDNASIAEAAGTATLTATLSAVSSKDVTINLGYTGTATIGTDFNNTVATSIVITAGNLSASASPIITAIQDVASESDETIIVDISGITNGTENGSQQQTVTIIDDDAVRFSVDDPAVTEGNAGTTTLSYTVSLNNAASGTVTVDYATSDGTATAGADYTALNTTTLTFAAGETSKTVVVSVIGDQILEGNETINLDLSNATGLSVIGDAQGVGSITNDDAAAVTIADVSGAENGGAITVTATLDNAVQGGFTVDVNTADGTATTADSDYTAITSQTLTFAGIAGETQTFAVIPTADTKLEANETITVSQTNLSATTLSVVISDAAAVTITNDDAAAVTIADVSGTENGGAITVTAMLDNAVQGGFTVDVNTADGTATSADSDYTAITSQTLTFAGIAGETQTFAVIPTADTKLEADETLTISQNNLSATTLGVVISDVATVTITNDDAATVTIADVSGAENGGAITVTATLDKAVKGGFTVDVNTADGTATTADSDYTAITSQTLTFAGTAGETQTFTVTPTADTKLEADETLTISQNNLSATTLNVVISDGATVTITNDDAAAVTIADISGAENDGAITVTATLDNAVQGGFTVDVNTADGTATTADSDYTSVTSQTLTFAGTAGETQTFTVTPTADTKLEADETLTISQNNLSATTLGIAISDVATVTITNDDAATVTIADVSGTENGGAITVTATLDNAVQGGFTVDVNTADGTATTADSDYTSVTSQTLTFAGTAGETQTFTVTPTADTKLEADETLTISQNNLSATTLGIAISDVATVTITNDDAATVTIADVSGTENGGAITVTATLDNAVQGGFTVDVNTADGTATSADSDYTAITSQTLTFAGTAGETQTFRVTPTADTKLEANETITVSQTNLSATTLSVAISDAATVTFNNDDAAAITIADVSGTENGGAITVTATLDNAVQGGFTVDVNTADGTATTADSDYTSVTSQTLTFAGIAGETQTFAVIPTADTKLEANETITVSQTNLSATTLSVVISDAAAVTITNDDAAAVTIADVSGTENGGAITVTAMLDNAVQGGFTVDVNTADGTATSADSDYTTITSQTLTFAGTAGETQTFTVTPTADTKLEADETLTISQNNLSATTLGVVISDVATVTITNDDAATVTIADVSGAENGGAITVTATLDKAVKGGFTVDVNTADGTATTADSDYTAITSQTLTFAGTAGETQTFTVTPTADTKLEADETLTISQNNLSATTLNVVISDGATVTINNDDAAAVMIADISGAENGGAITVTATLDNAVQGGFTVDMSSSDGTATTADSDYTAITSQTLTFAGAAGETQTFIVTPTADTKLEANETITVSQTNLSATTLSVAISDVAAVTITNDDAAAITFADVSGTENGGAITVTATLDNAVQGGFTVDVNTADGTATSADSDYTAITSQTLTFAGTAGEIQTFTVTPTADDTPEANETIQIIQSNLASTVLALNISNVGIVTIINDDDGIAPIGYTVTFDDALIGGSEVTTSKFTFAGAEVGTTYNYTVSSNGGGTNVTGSGTIITATDQITLADLSGLTDGTLTLSVTLTDPSSNVGAAVTAITSKDATAPAAPVVSSITTDSGANGADGITNDNTLSFNGTAEANSTVEVFIDAASISSTTADATGQWSINHETATLADATYAVTATATDAAGNATSSVAFNVTVDIVAPSAPVVDLAANSDSGVSSTDNLTSDNTPNLIGTAEVNATIEVFINGNSLGTTTTDGSGNWSITPSTAIAEGVNSITATATDAAGNSSVVGTLLIILDTVAPVDPVVTSPAAVTVNAVTQTIGGTHPEIGATVHIYADADNDGTADNTTSLANAVVSGNTWSLSVNLAADADNNFVVKAIDISGNESGEVDVPTITEDSTFPADPVVTSPASVTVNAATQTISGTHSENGIIVHAYVDADNDGTADNTTSLANAVVSGNTWSLSVNLVADSDNNFVVKAIDGAGNESGDVNVSTITEDSTVPADPVVTLPASAISLNAATQTISGTHAENGVTVYAYADANNDGTADNTTSLANAVVSGNAWSLSVNLTADSDNNFVVKATDGASNASGDVDVPTITEDSTIPTITNVTSSTANGTYGAGDQVSIQVEFSEAVTVNGAGLQLGLETGLDLFVALASGSGSSTLTFDLTIPVGHKTSDLDVRSAADLTIDSETSVEDAAGNTANLTLPTGSDANSLATNKDIVINSEPTVTLSVDNSRIDEATGTATLTATLSAVSPSDVTVTIAYSGTAVSGTEYNNTASTSITVIAGQISADAAVIITPVNDINPETNETIIADITGVTNGTEDGVQQETITIVDDDSPSVSFATSASSGDESTSSTDLTVNTTIVSALTVTVDYTLTGTAAGGGTDYTLANGTLTFNPGSTSEIITIAGIVDDAILEANETVIVTLSSPANANLGANILHTYTITDNDAAALTIADVSGAENGGAITVTARLDNAVQGGFTVDVSSADGTATTADSDYTAITSQTLTFAGTAGETQTFTVTPTADTKLEADETLTISQANLSATTLGVAISDGATVTITNDDAAAVTFATVSGIEDVGAITVTATLDNAVQGAFTVDVSTADGTATLANNDYTAITSQTLTFVGTAGENQTFTVTPIGDSSPESNETVLLNLSNLVGTLLAVDISAIGTVTILDDDDGTAPSGYSVTMDDGLIGGSEVTTSKFTFAGAEVAATYNYTVSSDGGGTNVTGTGTIATATDQITIADLSGLSDGTLTLSVTLTDPSSNVGAAVTASTSKDATAPAAPVVSTITTDSGASGGDRITNDNTLSFNGTAEANATLEVFIDAASIGSTTADATGQWSFNHETATLTDANYAITATATDAAGNTSSSSTALSVTIDTAAPAAPVVSSITNDTGANGTDQSTNDPTLSFDGTAQANSTIEVFIDAVNIGTTTADAGGQWSFNHESTTLSDASYSVTAKATDIAGNTSAESAALTVNVDTAAPAAPTIDLDVSFDTGTSDSDNLTNATTLKFNGTAEANADIEVFINDVSFGVTVADVVGAWALTTSPLTLTGDISVKAVATDQVSNTGPNSEVLTVTIDTELASPTLLPADNAMDILPTTDLVLTFAEDVIKSGNTIAIRKTSDDSILESFDVSSSKVTVSGSTVTIDLENTLPPATEVYVTISQGALVDNAGNDYAGISTTTDWSFTTVAASVVSSVAAPTADTYGIGDALDFTVTMVLPVTITGTATIPVTIGTATVNATQVGTVSNSSTITFRHTVVENELDADGIAVGSAINLNGGTMKDAFGVDAILTLNNIATTTAVLVDGVRPTPTITNANTTDPVNGIYTVLVEFDEPVAGFSATDLTVSNGTSSNFTNLSSDTKWSFGITPTADGTVSVSLAAGVASDNAGNASAAGVAVTKTFDGTAPSVSSITRKDADQLNSATTSANFRVVFSEDVLGVDLTDFELSLTGTAASLNTVTQVDAKTYDVNVNGILGQGTVGLNVKDDDSILDNAANKLGGSGLTNGDFTGDFYTTNFLPTDITSAPASISENNAIGDIVGALTSTDADTGDSHAYTLVSGTGDTDNASFSIDGTNLKAGAVFDFEAKDSYSIRLKTDDGNGGSFEKVLTITIDNVLEPSIFVTGDGTFDVSALGLSQTRTLTVTNDGEKPIEVRVSSTPVGFSILPGSFVLATGASTDIAVTFVPTEVRSYAGNIILTHEGGNEAHPVSGEGAIITSVDDGIINSADINMYPNPTSRLLTIDLSALNGSKLDITIVNATGVAMFSRKDHTDQELTLDVSGYKMGIYIVQFTNGHSVVRKKVMIKR